MKFLQLMTLGLVLYATGAVLAEDTAVADTERIENWTDKTVMVVTPHPDDDTFSCAGTMALLVKNGNKVIVVLYTNGDKGSRDLEMTSERMARIRRAEEETACAVLGIPKENIIWLGYEDGNLEYADPQRLRGEICRLFKKHRPDAVFTIDPGKDHERWHKTDHRRAAFITKDAFIAAEWHLYYPQHLLNEGIEPYRVPVAYYYYSTESNYTVDITDVIELKIKAAASHVSQFPPAVDAYTPKMAEATLAGIRGFAMARQKDGRLVEEFRRETSP